MNTHTTTQETPVIAEPRNFKAMLGIGEDAYQSLRRTRVAREIWDFAGAAGTGATIANSTLVATTFFAPKGLLGVLGLATAATPIGWVIAAGAVSALSWYGISQYLKRSADERLEVIPKYLNTQLDLLATSVIRLLLPLALKMAAADGQIDERERGCLRDYFVRTWGYDTQFVEIALDAEAAGLHAVDAAAIAQCLAAFSRANPDCNPEVMAREAVLLLQAVMEADGVVDAAEEEVLHEVQRVLASAQGQTATQVVASALDASATGIRERAAELARTTVKTLKSVERRLRRGSVVVATASA